MPEKVIVITGASGGIGAAAARILKSHGHHVVIVGRSAARTKKIAGELGAPYFLADFAKLDDVRTLADLLQSAFPRIDVLANNAGGMMGDRTLTVDGNELTVQVNHLAPFLLTNLLLETLAASKASVIATTSVAHRVAGHLNLDDFTMARHYSPQRAYGRAKLMNILFTKELDARFHAEGISSAAFHPGAVRTRFSTEFGGILTTAYSSFFKQLMRSPARGAKTMVWLAESSPGQEWHSGQYFKDEKIARASKQTANAELASRLWDLSSHLTNS